MEDKKKSCGCVRECPCFPRCDEMMDQGQMQGGMPQNPWRNPSDRMTSEEVGMAQPGMMPGSGAGMTQPGMMPGSSAGMAQPGMMPGNSAGMTPWYRTAPMQSGMNDFGMEEDERDWMRLKEMYPDMAKIILSEVERACDKMEYEGSAMFDTVPDKNRVRDMANEILEAVSDRISAEQVEDQADLYTMNREPCRNCRPNQNFLGDFIQVLLFQEMFHRRCRHRNCRRW